MPLPYISDVIHQLVGKMFKQKRKLSLDLQRCRLNNVGLLIYQAASIGMNELESVFSTLPSSEVVKGVNYADKHGITPLILAVRRGCLGSVKLLLYHGADICYSLKRPLHNEKIWTTAKKAGYFYLEQYLKKCYGDMRTMSTTRAQLEILVKGIAMNPQCSHADQMQFDICLKQLIKRCDIDIEGTSDHEHETQPLLIRAASADNIPIVMKLIKNFNVNVENHDLHTAQTIMHIACERMSKLRFYLVKHYPRLLTKKDITGKLPLHIACAQNDIQFISWLFGSILAIEDDEEDSVSENSSMARTRSLSDILSPSPSIPPNKSLQVMFPKFRANLTSKRVPPTDFSSDYEGGDDNDDDTGYSDGIYFSGSQPPSVSLRSGVFGIDRSLSASCSGSSKSGSSEFHGKISARKVLQNSKAKEVLGVQINGSYPSNGIESSNDMEDAIKISSSDLDSKPSAFVFNTDGNEHNEVIKEPQKLSLLGYSDEFMELNSSLPFQQAEVNELLSLESLVTQHPLTRTEIVETKPFSVDEEGDTIFHILARNDYYESLSVIVRVANFLKHQVKLDMLTNREGFHCRLPIEEALHVRSHKCVQKLIQLSMAAGLMPELLQDPHVLKCAVFVNDVKLVRILIENGFHQGIKPAISLAILSEYHELLRILLFWQTQVINSVEYARLKKSKGQRLLCLDKGTIKWCEIQLETIHHQWLFDAACAASSVSQCLRFSSIYGDITEKNFEYFRALGIECLQYFDNLSYPGLVKTLHVPLVPVTEVNISENQLRCVPIELFQMQNLRVLRLSHNALTELPSCPNLQDNMYTSQLVKIDLDWNFLQDLPEELFRGVARSLVELSVQYNQLQRLPPGLWVMPNLKKIKLAHNKLERLHTLSLPCNFVDFGTSNNVKVMFDTDHNGELLCFGDKNALEVQQLMKYLQSLANFYLTVCAARGLSDNVNASCIWRDVIDIHIARCCTLQQGTDEVVNTAIDREPQMLRIFEGDDDLDSVIKCTLDLELLDLSYNKFSTFPWDLACIAPKLQKLDFRGNELVNLDIVHSIPKKIHSLILVKNKLLSLNRERSFSLPCGNVLLLLCSDDLSIDGYCQHCNHSTLEQLSNLMLDQNRLNLFPILDSPRIEASSLTSGLADFEIVQCDTFYPELSILSLARNKFTTVPKQLHQLVHLSSLDLSYNEIMELPLDMGLMNISNLLLLKLDGMYIRNVPEALLGKPKQLLNHLKALKQKSQPYRRMKLMIVGGANIGKTSLLVNLVKKGKMKRFTELEMGVNDRPLSTVGVELGDWEYWQGNRPKVTFMTWDFGGQEEYYATHQCFLTRRSLYLLLWDITQGIEGLKSLQPWLENIEGRAPKSPVIVVATHLDQVPQADRNNVTSKLQAKFEELYLKDTHRKYTYPRIHEQCQFISINSTKNIDALRDYIYDFALLYKVPVGPRAKNATPLLDEPIPQSYLVLQDIVQETAQRCEQLQQKPILTKKEFLHTIRDSRQTFDETDLEQATSFLHDSGILLHFEDSSLLNNLYFISPQWLCSMLAKLIAIKETNPYQRNGFMLMKDVFKIYDEICEEFLIFMQKFEVVLKLDDNRLLIPSLLPSGEEDSCVVFSQAITKKLLEFSPDFDQLPSEMPHVHIYEIPHPIITRFYLLPFIPSGFFARIMARLMSSEIIDILNECLLNNQLGMSHVVNSTHWKCWRNGIIITWNHFEIFRIAPLCSTLPGANTVGLITKRETCEHLKELKGIEIKVAILPEEYIVNCCILEGQLSNTSGRDPREKVTRTGRSLASWLLHHATTKIESVFEDWYESFARNKGFDPQEENVRIVNPCTQCMKDVEKERLRLLSEPHLSLTLTECPQDRMCYMFTSPYVAHASSSEEVLVCPIHGTQSVADVAPDMVFSDFLCGTIFTNPSSLTIRERLGDGGFGTVFRATLHTGGTVLNVAAKQFTPDSTCTDENPEIVAQLKAWDIYQKASLEARVMHQLSHPNILGLLGISLRPLTLLVELAPEGDLKKCLERFRRNKVKLSRRTLQATLIQVAEALNYLHSRQFIYRDLKPENVLVWSFPLPETQWCFEASIYVKVADYGISKEITPQGIRGVEGTRPYLPPEVILHGGREAYSNKVDVYAFGMFIYFLISFRSPFDSGRPISALLEEGKRPELPAKLRPSCIQVIELMCWCWSDLPNYRPDFTTILSILKTDMFTRLLASFPLTGNKEEVTSSCIRQFKARRLTPSCSFLPEAPFGPKNILNIDDFGTQVWYGTDFGKCGIIQFQNNGISHETFELARNKYITNIGLINGNIWIATMGCGLSILNPNSKDILTQWGAAERYQIYTFLEVPEKQFVLVLTHRGMYVFDSSDKDIDKSFKPKQELQKLDKEISVGVVISPYSEIWITSQQAKVLYILETENFAINGKVPFVSGDIGTNVVRHLVTVEASNKVYLALACKHIIYLIDAGERKQTEHQFNCQEICAEGVEGAIGVRADRVTALTASDHFLYAATRRGVIICLNCITMQPCTLMDAYYKPCRSLLLINTHGQQSRPFQRLFSRGISGLKPSLSSSSCDSMFSNSESFKMVQGSQRRRSSVGSTGTCMLEDDYTRSVLLSFGVGYRGVIGESTSFPENFMLPSENTKTFSQSAVPDRTIGFLLLWSKECEKKDSAKFTDLLEIDEQDSILSENLIQGFSD